MPRLQGLLFDLDGTLLDSAPDLRQAVNLLMKKYERPELGLDEIKGMTGDGIMPLVERAFAATGEALDDDVYPYVQEFIAFYRGVEPDPAQIFPHALEILSLFKEKGVKLGVCTNKATAATTRILGALDMTKYFDFIAGGDTFEVHKPNPGHLLGTIEKIGAAPEGCVFVGDGPNDAHAADAAGLPCLVMSHGYCEDVHSLGADKVLDGFDEIPAALTELGFVWEP